MRISAELGDITTVGVDVIVNAANASLLGGGGVDGAIHEAAGPALLAACRALRATSHPDGLRVGDATVTPGFALPSRWVVHTVGPDRHRGQTDPALLRSCFTSSLHVAHGLGATSIAFPAVSAGVFGWEADEVARIAIDAVQQWAVSHDDSPVRDVRFVLFNERLLDAFERALTGDS